MSIAKIRIAQAIGFTGAAWLSGNIAALSLNALPALLQSRREDDVSITVLARQWRNVFDAGKRQNPPVAAATAAAFFYLSWSVRSGSPLFRPAAYSRAGLYLSGALLTLGIIPFTIIAMSRTNNALLNHARLTSEPSSATKKEAEELLNRWTNLNGFRSLLPLAGGLLGITAALI